MDCAKSILGGAKILPEFGPCTSGLVSYKRKNIVARVWDRVWARVWATAGTRVKAMQGFPGTGVRKTWWKDTGLRTRQKNTGEGTATRK